MSAHTILRAALTHRIGKPIRLDEDQRIHPEEVQSMLAAVRLEASRRGFVVRDGWRLVVEFDTETATCGVGGVDPHDRMRRLGDALVRAFGRRDG